MGAGAMIVLVLQNVPQGLRGQVTRWLLEIDSGVYVGNLGARVRERLWNTVIDGAGTGSATMVWSARNEQGMDFRVHGNPWEVIDIEGLRLVRRPLPEEDSGAEGRRGRREPDFIKWRRASRFRGR